jgi:pyrroline-5-carboxylate reductase
VSDAPQAGSTADAPAADHILLVGCGKMGGALLRGWCERRAARGFAVVEPGPGAGEFRDSAEVALYTDAEKLPADFDPSVIVFAVKPQMMDAVVPQYRRFATGGAVFLSIAAGKTTAYFPPRLGQDAAVVRAMPNTPAAIGRGISVAFAGPGVTPAQAALCGGLLEAVGEVAWVSEEALMDPVTAVSGSGPAYVFLLIECLAAAAVEVGLPAALAMQLARATVAGSGALAEQANEDPAVLRRNVTSPGGATEAALRVLMAKDGLQPLMSRAVAAAASRSRELADEAGR